MVGLVNIVTLATVGRVAQSDRASAALPAPVRGGSSPPAPSTAIAVMIQEESKRRPLIFYRDGLSDTGPWFL